MKMKTQVVEKVKEESHEERIESQQDHQVRREGRRLESHEERIESLMSEPLP